MFIELSYASPPKQMIFNSQHIIRIEANTERKAIVTLSEQMGEGKIAHRIWTVNETYEQVKAMLKP